MKAKSIHGKSPEAFQLALEESVSDGFNPSLAIVFISIKQDRKAIDKILGNFDIDVFGATSAGEFTDEQQSECEIAALLIDINKDYYTILMDG